MAVKQFGVGFPAATTPLAGTETLSVVQGGVTVDTTVQDIANKAPGATPPTGTGYRHMTAGVEDATAKTAANTATDLQGDGSSSTAAGFRGIPQNSQSAAYTLVMSDNGKSIYHPTSDTTARVWTIPANASVAFPIGAAVTFDNDQGAGAITIAITSDTLVLVGTGSTGSRTLATGGTATAWKVTATRWRIQGTGLT